MKSLRAKVPQAKETFTVAEAVKILKQFVRHEVRPVG